MFLEIALSRSHAAKSVINSYTSNVASYTLLNKTKFMFKTYTFLYNFSF